MSRQHYQQDKPSTVRVRRWRHRRICMIMIALALGWGAATWFDQRSVLDAKMSELDAVNLLHQEVYEENQAYHREIARLHDPEYIEQRARLDLHMIGGEEDILFFSPDRDE